MFYSIPASRARAELLIRTAFGYAIHPRAPDKVVLFGGYGVDCANQQHDPEVYDYLKDVAVLDTTR